MKYFIWCFIFYKMVLFERCRGLALLTKLKKERRQQVEMQRVILFTIAHRRSCLLKVSRLLSELLTSLRESEPLPHPKSTRRWRRNGGWWDAVWNTYSDERFKQIFRVSRGTFQYIVGKLYASLMKAAITEEPISPECLVAMSLYHLGRGDYLYTLAELAGIGESTTCGIVVEVCHLIIDVVWEESVSKLWPDSEEKMLDLMRCMDAEWQFIFAYAAIDGSHISIHCTPGGAATLIDHIASSHPENIPECGVLTISLSDHYAVYCIRKFMGSFEHQQTTITTRKMKNFSQERLLPDLCQVDWDQIVESSRDVNEAVTNWSTLLSLIVEKHAPMKTMKVSDRLTPWLTTEFKKLARTRDKFKAAAVKSKSTILLESYKQLRNNVNNLNKKLKKEYFSKKIAHNKGNFKETWKTINSLLNRSKTTKIECLKVDNQFIIYISLLLK